MGVVGYGGCWIWGLWGMMIVDYGVWRLWGMGIVRYGETSVHVNVYVFFVCFCRAIIFVECIRENRCNRKSL